MMQVGFYRELHRDRITESVREEGFDPICVTDPPGRIYPAHRHAETKLLVFLEGEMMVNVGGESYQCSAGDRLVIQSNVEHSARVGSQGCVFLWSEKLDKQ